MCVCVGIKDLEKEMKSSSVFTGARELWLSGSKPGTEQWVTLFLFWEKHQKVKESSPQPDLKAFAGRVRQGLKGGNPVVELHCVTRGLLLPSGHQE